MLQRWSGESAIAAQVFLAEFADENVLIAAENWVNEDDLSALIAGSSVGGLKIIGVPEGDCLALLLPTLAGSGMRVKSRWFVKGERIAMPRKKSVSAADNALAELRAFGLAYPGAHTKSPWPGHLDLAVNDKTFAYLSVEGEPFSISCKLPRSNNAALMLPFTTPTAYGLGKSGWVTAQLESGEAPPVDLFKEWIEESYRAQAPKRLVALLQEAKEAPKRSAPARPSGG